jgi:hypothetical protein
MAGVKNIMENLSCWDVRLEAVHFKWENDTDLGL